MKFGEVKSEIWALLGETSNSTTFSNDRLSDTINMTLKRVVRGAIPSKLDARVIYRVKSLSFMEGKKVFRVINDTSLGADYNTGDMTITADTTNYPSAGKLLIGPEIVTYTGKTGTTFTGVNGNSVKYFSGEPIIPLYQLPVDCDRPNTVTLIDNGEFNITQKGSRRFDLHTGYIEMIGFSADDLIEVKYTKSPTDITDDNVVIIIPDPYGKMLAKLIAGEFALEYTLPQAQNLLIDAYKDLQEMYGYYSSTLGEIATSIKPTPYGFSSIKNVY